MDHDDTPSASRQSAPHPAGLPIDWDGWRREVRAVCSDLRRQIERVGQGVTPEAASAAELPLMPTAERGAQDGEVPPAREDRLALLKRQINSQIESSEAARPRASG